MFITLGIHHHTWNAWVIRIWKYITLLVYSIGVFVFVIVFAFVFVFVFVFPIRFWIAIIISFQKMYGLGGLGQVEVGERRRRAKWLKKEEEKEKTRCRSVPDGSDNHCWVTRLNISATLEDSPLLINKSLVWKFWGNLVFKHLRQNSCEHVMRKLNQAFRIKIAYRSEKEEEEKEG